MPPRRMEVKFLDKLAASYRPLAKAGGYAVATLCRPNSKSGKRKLKLGQIQPLKNRKKIFRPFGHRSVEVGLGFYYQQNAYPGWGCG
jgi:hypothetical protein